MLEWFIMGFVEGMSVAILVGMFSYKPTWRESHRRCKRKEGKEGIGGA